MDEMSFDAPRARVAVVSLHTSPLDQPGTGDSGGMNVYVRAIAERLGSRGIAVDVFTRCAGRGVPEVERLGPLGRVIQLQAGPCAEVAKPELPGVAPDFAESLLRRVETEGLRYDLIHSHYWLSGDAALAASRRWGVPVVASFHTLGMVKDLSLGGGEDREPTERLASERRLISSADRVLAPTPAEAAHLIELYEAGPDRIRVVPPGVDRELFRPRSPRSRAAARRALGLEGERVALFVGRLQPLKGPDVAIRALAEAVRLDPRAAGDLVLAVVGGPSGPRAGLSEALWDLAASLGVADRVRFFPPRPHEELAEVYAAADVVLMPSRSESFGLVALEAQASGVPVVASSVGGLRYVVGHGQGGFVVRANDAAGFGSRVVQILRDPELAASLASGASSQAHLYPWEATADRLVSVYGELVPSLVPQPVS
jgi:D-inositol-3-phosphate glycosyltransferase